MFTDEKVTEYAESFGVEKSREAVALAVENRYEDYLEAWEIRTGKHWTSMTSEEALLLIEKHPQLLLNPAVIKRLKVDYFK